MRKGGKTVSPLEEWLPEIRQLRNGRRWSWRKISGWLAERGVEVSHVWVRIYVLRARRRRSAGTDTAARKKAPREKFDWGFKKLPGGFE